VLTNLLSNAVKFTPEDGEVSLGVTLLAENDSLCRLQFSVTDNGIGISAEQQTRLFTSFQQADNSTSRRFGGTGLGLSISKRIVELMGGDIRVESELGHGSVFTFTINAERGKADHPSLLNPGVNWKNVSILAVDDDPETLAYFRELALTLGIKLDAASDAEEARAILDRGVLHDIYFLDYKMPGMSGLELCRTIKDSRADKTAVAIISAADWSSISEHAKTAGVDRFVSKPLHSSDIEDCINEFLGNTAPAEETASDDEPDNFKGHTILLAEDVEINREIVVALLEPTEVTVDCAENGAEAVRLFTENPERYDLILMDVQMPQMDGLEATRVIRALDVPEAKTVPIVALTANVFRDDVEKCREAGMNSHLGKPLILDALLAELRKYCV
jgi:CheY-like chemotaxis protein